MHVKVTNCPAFVSAPEHLVGVVNGWTEVRRLLELRLRCSVLGLDGLSVSLQVLVLKLPSRSSCRAASCRRDLSAGTTRLGEPSDDQMPPCPWGDIAWLPSLPGLGCSSSQAASKIEEDGVR